MGATPTESRHPPRDEDDPPAPAPRPASTWDPPRSTGSIASPSAQSTMDTDRDLCLRHDVTVPFRGGRKKRNEFRSDRIGLDVHPGVSPAWGESVSAA